MQAVVANQNLTSNVAESAAKLRKLFYEIVPIRPLNPTGLVAVRLVEQAPAVLQRRAKIDAEAKGILAPFLSNEAKLNQLRAEYLKQSEVSFGARMFDLLLAASDYHRVHPSTLDKDFSRFLTKTAASQK